MIKNRSAFTLIELVIAMAIMAILIVLGIVGIGIVQQNSRDVERTNAISAISTLINDYKKTYLSVPSKENVVFSQGLARIVGFKDYELKGSLTPTSSTTSSGTRYFYNNVSSSNFVICVLLESGTVKGAGTSVCPPVTSWF